MEKFQVFNHTDGVWASAMAMSKSEAEQFVQEFPGRFRRQGYYLTAARERIPPRDVELEVFPVQ